MPQKKLIFDKTQVEEAIDRIADDIIAEFKVTSENSNPIALLGIQKQGVPFARRLSAAIKRKTSCQPLEGILDISMYRDDYGMRKKLPVILETIIPFTVDDCNVIIADDVLASGRTIRAALDALTDYGRPRIIRLAVMYDRCCNEYPIRADYAGWSQKTAANKKIVVEFEESDGNDGVYEKPWNKGGEFKA